MNKIYYTAQILILPFKQLLYWVKTDRKHLPGYKFFYFGIRTSLKLLFRGMIKPKLFFNPVSIVRYFEYDFAASNFKVPSNSRVLDISSPFLFGLYIVDKYVVDYFYTNPDAIDLNNVKKIKEKLKLNRFHTDPADATKLDYDNNTFETVISISVIEHIYDKGDSTAMKEMWRVLKPGGFLIFTVPVKRKYEIQYTTSDLYNLNQDLEPCNEYFFQRLYDEEEIEKRLFNQITGYEIVQKSIFGEKSKDFYSNYVKRWNSLGYVETVKDPYYIAKYFKVFSGIEKLPGIGVIGYAIRKK